MTPNVNETLEVRLFPWVSLNPVSTLQESHACRRIFGEMPQTL